MSKSVWVGLGFILVGLLIFLELMDAINSWRFFATWYPILIFGAGVTTLINKSYSIIFSIFLMVSGLLLQGLELKLLTIDVLPLIFSLTLIFAGISLLMGRSKKYLRKV